MERLLSSRLRVFYECKSMILVLASACRSSPGFCCSLAHARIVSAGVASNISSILLPRSLPLRSAVVSREGLFGSSLLIACLVSLVCKRAPYLHLFGLSSLELGSSLCRCVCVRLKWKRWETILLIVILESSSRLAPGNMAVSMASSTTLLAWRSTSTEIS